MKEKVYIAGPITGFDREERRHTFAAAAVRLQAAGFETVNPFDLHPDDVSWAEAMKADIPELIKCQRVYLQRGWEASKGSRLEETIAVALGLKLMYESDETWLGNGALAGARNY